jgi:hypothetical protein
MQVVYVGVESIFSTIMIPQWVIPDRIGPWDAAITPTATVRKSIPVTETLRPLADRVHKSHTVVQNPAKTHRKPQLVVQNDRCSR